MRKLLSSEQEDNFDDGLINLTPLIDVVFVVLIVFILIAPMIEMERVDLVQGSSQKEKSVAAQGSKIILAVKSDNTLWLNKEKITMSALPKKLKELKVKFPKENPRLFHDQTAQFGMYHSVKTTLEECGFDELDLVVDPKR